MICGFGRGRGKGKNIPGGFWLWGLDMGKRRKNTGVK